MARGRQRIRQRGSRQQWAQARSYKAFGADGLEVTAEPGSVDGEPAGPPKPLGGADVDVTAHELADLASATIEVALAEAIRGVSRRYGAPPELGASQEAAKARLGRERGDEGTARVLPEL